MLTALLTFAAETAEHAEPSKAPFYITGGILAAWGFLIGTLGTMRHGDFPNAASSRLVIGVSAVLVAATMAGAVVSG